MKNARPRPLEIQIGTAPQSVCATSMKKSSATMALFRHHIGVGSWGLRSSPQETDINFVRATIVEDAIP